MIKPCKWCGTPFEARGKARYCNDGCRIQFDRVNDRRRDQKPARQLQKARAGARWHTKNRAEANRRARERYIEKREIELARQREYHRQKLAGELIPRTCRCGRAFWVKPDSRRWFCTRECRYQVTYRVTVWIMKTLRRLDKGEITAAQIKCGMAESVRP